MSVLLALLTLIIGALIVDGIPRKRNEAPRKPRSKDHVLPFPKDRVRKHA